MTQNRSTRVGAIALTALAVIGLALDVVGRVPDHEPDRDAAKRPLPERGKVVLSEYLELVDRPLVGFLAGREVGRTAPYYRTAVAAQTRYATKPTETEAAISYRSALDLLAAQVSSTADLSRLLFWFVAAALLLVLAAAVLALFELDLVGLALLVLAVLPALFPAALASPAGILTLVFVPLAAMTLVVCGALGPGPAGPLVRGLEVKLAHASPAARAKAVAIDVAAGIALLAVAAAAVAVGIALHGGVIVVGGGLVIAGFMRIGRAIAYTARLARAGARRSA